MQRIGSRETLLLVSEIKSREPSEATSMPRTEVRSP